MVLNSFYNKIQEATEEIWSAINGENGLQEQMTQFDNANKLALQEATEEIWTAINGEGDSLSTQMSQYYNANKAAIEENTNKIELLEDALASIVSPADPESVLNRMNESFAEMAEQIEALQAQIEELKKQLESK